MRLFNVPLFAAMAVALLPLDANAGSPLVDIQSVDPTIVVELRYAGRNNLVGYLSIRAEHVLSRVQKSLRVWLPPRRFCGATNLG